MASGSRSFNFGTDDVLCSYDDKDSSTSLRSDPPSKDFSDSRMARPLVNIYSDSSPTPKEDLTSTVERCMKKYADTLMRALDGISGRLSQLETLSHSLDRSVADLRADVAHGQNISDGKFNSLQKHIQEVHRAVQILRDKQELAEAQKELAKLQTLQKDSTQKTEEPATQTQTPKRVESPKQVANNQLALVPSTPQQQLALPQIQDNSQYVASHATGYQTLPPAPAGFQYVQARTQLQEIAPPVQPQMVQQQLVAKTAPFPQYQQQWTAPHQTNPNPNPQQFTAQNPNPQQFTAQQNPNPTQQFTAQPNPNPQQFTAQPNPNPTQQFPPQSNPNTQQFTPQQNPNPTQQFPPQSNPNTQQFTPQQNPNPSPQQFAPQSSQQTQMRPQMPPPVQQQGYSTYPPPQPSNPIPETYPTNLSIPPPYSSPSQPTYPGQGNTRPFGPPAQIPKPNYPNAPPYMQGNVPPSYNTGSYSFPPNNVVPRGSPYGEFIEKAVSMGYPREQVVSVAMKMAESGQHMDFNALLDRLNGVTSQWSG